jgi:hypothetical protein
MLKEMHKEINNTFDDFYKNLLKAIPGDKSLERASAIFQMNEAKLTARHRALVSAVEIELEERRIQIQRELDTINLTSKATGTN